MNAGIFALRLTLLSFMVLALTACPPKRSKGNNSTQVKTVVMGDPNKVIEGSSLNSNINFAFFEGLQTLKLRTMVGFVEKRQVRLGASVNQESLEKANAPSEAGEGDKYVELNVKTNGETVSLTHPKFSIDLSSRLVAGKRKVITSANGVNSEAELLHFSVSEDGQEMSLLMRTRTAESGTAIVAMWFTKGGSSQSRMTLNQQYNYLNGPGVKSAWSSGRPIEIQSCGANSRHIVDVITNSVNQWNSALAGRQRISLSENVRGYAPLSDLNQHCIYVVDSFLVEPSEVEAIYGVTTTIVSNSSIIDSDVLIFAKELAKNESGRIRAKMERTVLHELGHLLGLDHKFKGPASIMSYNFNDGGVLTAYDHAAIQELYK